MKRNIYKIVQISVIFTFTFLINIWGAHANENSSVCEAGYNWNSIKKLCTKVEETPARIEISYKCSNGQLRGNNCVSSSEVNKVWVDTTSCPTGTTREGSWCVGTELKPPKYEQSCPPGSIESLAGSNSVRKCYSEVEPVSCPSGYHIFEGSICVSSNIEFKNKGGSAPSCSSPLPYAIKDRSNRWYCSEKNSFEKPAYCESGKTMFFTHSAQCGELLGDAADISTPTCEYGYKYDQGKKQCYRNVKSLVQGEQGYFCPNGSNNISGSCYIESSVPARKEQKLICDGEYELLDGRCIKEVVVIPNDTISPNIQFMDNSDKIVTSVFGVRIKINDNLDDNLAVDVKFMGGKGGSNKPLKLSSRNGDEYYYISPNTSDLIRENEIRVEVTAEDFMGNRTSKERVYKFEPRKISLEDGMNGDIYIPAIGVDFYRPNGIKAITTKVIYLDDEGKNTLSGLEEVKVSWSGSEPLVVEGVTIPANVTNKSIGYIDFSKTGGKLELSIASYNKEPTKGNLIVQISNPRTPLFSGVVNVWKPDFKIESTEKVETFFGILNGKIFPKSNDVACRLSGQAYKSLDNIKDPVCVMEITSGSGVFVDNNNEDGSFVARSFEDGKKNVDYRVYIRNGNGDKNYLYQDNFVFDSVPANLTFSFEHDEEVFSRISTFSASLKNNEDKCYLRAVGNYSQTMPTSQSAYCIIEWLDFTDNFKVDERMYSFFDPTIIGTANDHEEIKANFRVYVYGLNGIRYNVGTYSSSIHPEKPKIPEIIVSSDYLVKDSLYVVPLDERKLGQVEYSYNKSRVKTSINVDGKLINGSRRDTISGDTEGMVNEIPVKDNPSLWETDIYSFDAAYQMDSEIRNTKDITVTYSPSKNIVPLVTFSDKEALNTETFGVKVSMINSRNLDQNYTSSVFGIWSVRLYQQKGPNDYEPISDYKKIDDKGEVLFGVEFGEDSENYYRILAEAVLESPIESYERKVFSPSSRFVSVLNGNPIDSQIEPKRISGPAPFSSLLALRLEDRDDYRSLGNIEWLVKKDGQNWKSISSNKQPALQFKETFEETGEYKVKAVVYNKNSQKSFETQGVDIIAYDDFDIYVHGNERVFSGEETTLFATSTRKIDNSVLDNVIVEWSLDRGKTYNNEGDFITLSSDKKDTFNLVVRARQSLAPETDPNSYIYKKARVEFLDVKPPRVKFVNEKIMEKGKDYQVSVIKSTPYRGIDKKIIGNFILPDGSVQMGEELKYTPNEKDIQKGRVEFQYEAWFEGYEDVKSLSTSKVRAWEYIWPDFALSKKVSSNFAPVDINLSVRPVAFRGKLENVKYEWNLPEQAQSVNGNNSNISFTLNEPGDYTITVLISDGRGNSTKELLSLLVEEAPSYSVELKYSSSNKYDREPLDVVIRPYIDGGHPRDRVEVYEYSLNGTKIPNSGRYGRVTLESGQHEIVFSAESRMGRKLEETLQIDVNPNQMPVCNATIRESTIAWTVTADCVDNDGRVANYEWLINEQVVSISSRKITISKREYDTVPEITLVGIDDAGGRSEAISIQ